MKPSLLHVFFICFVMANTAFAVRMASIYQAEIPVATQSVADRNQVLSKALLEVLVKASGNDQIVDNTEIMSSLERAPKLIQEFSYYTPKQPINGKPYVLRVVFDANGVNRLLRSASVQAWGSNRPLILAWVDYEVPGKAGEIIDSSSQNKILEIVKKAANRRGLPIVFPSMDLTDINNVTLNDIVTMKIPTLQEASKRYLSDAIVIIRVFKSTSEYTAQAKLVFGNHIWDWEMIGKNRPDLLEALVDNITEELAGRYGNEDSKTIKTRLTLTVTGIMQEDDYNQMLDYVKHLLPVASLEVAKIVGTQVTLSVSLRSTRDAFMQLLSLGNKLTPMPPVAITGAESDKNIIYQWNR